MTKLRIGQGFDAHRWMAGKPLVLGGIAIPYHAGLEAYSDGDVVIHAVCDALLGASGSNDIGYHFPDTHSGFQDIDSQILLRRVVEMLEIKSYHINNVDITILAEAPKLITYYEAMRFNLAAVMKIQTEQVNIKATTLEKMGFIGRDEGMAALAVALISS